MTGLVLGLRWGIEIALFLIIVYAFLIKINKSNLLIYSYLGVSLGVTFVLACLTFANSFVEQVPQEVAFAISVLALMLLLAVVIVMIHLDHHSESKEDNKITKILNKKSTPSFIFWFSCLFISHHIFELLGFYLIDQLTIISVIIGLAISAFVGFLAMRGLVKIKIHFFINLTTVYLILQIGALFSGIYSELSPSIGATIFDISAFYEARPVINFFMETLLSIQPIYTLNTLIVQLLISGSLMSYWIYHEKSQPHKH